jgi:cyclase
MKRNQSTRGYNKAFVKWNILFLSSALMCISVNAASQDIIERRISESVIVLQGWDRNVTAVATKDGLVVFDTFMNPAAARCAREHIEAFNGKPIRYVVNTHYHADHTFGNQVFSDAVIIGHEKILERIEANYGKDIKGTIAAEITELENRLQAAKPGSEEAKGLENRLAAARKEQEDFADFILTPPSIRLNGGATLYLGGKTFEILYLGPAHSDTDFVILVPEERLLIMGDLLMTKRLPYLDWEAEADLENWITIFDNLITESHRYDHVIPGHGKITDVEGLKEHRESMVDLWTTVEDVWNRGLTLEQAKEEIGLEKYSDYIFFELTRAHSIEGCWRILERKSK